MTSEPRYVRVQAYLCALLWLRIGSSLSDLISLRVIWRSLWRRPRGAKVGRLTGKIGIQRSFSPKKESLLKRTSQSGDGSDDNF